MIDAEGRQKNPRARYSVRYFALTAWLLADQGPSRFLVAHGFLHPVDREHGSSTPHCEPPLLEVQRQHQGRQPWPPPRPSISWVPRLGSRKFHSHSDSQQAG